MSLSIFVYQAIRSKKVIDVLYRFGYGTSCDEVRKFLTSLTANQIENNGEVFIPQGIVPVRSVEDFVHASIDNFDQNEETLDGKGTTHSLAMVLFQKSNSLFEDTTFKRNTKRSLQELDVDNSTLHQNIVNYQKPPYRPEPERFDQSIITNCLELQPKDDKINTDVLWKLLCYTQNSPGWREFNESISLNDQPV